MGRMTADGDEALADKMGKMLNSWRGVCVLCKALELHGNGNADLHHNPNHNHNHDHDHDHCDTADAAGSVSCHSWQQCRRASPQSIAEMTEALALVRRVKPVQYAACTHCHRPQAVCDYWELKPSGAASAVGNRGHPGWQPKKGVGGCSYGKDTLHEAVAALLTIRSRPSRTASSFAAFVEGLKLGEKTRCKAVGLEYSGLMGYLYRHG